MHSNTQPNVGVEREENVPNAQASPRNLTSWHLVPTHSINPHVESISQKPSLKLKIVRHPANNQNSSKSYWLATPKQIPERHELIIKLTSSKNELDEQKSTTVEVDSEQSMPQKRTPWYLLPRKPVIEAEPPKPVSLVSTFKERNSKHRVANKPKPEYMDSANELSEELFLKLENFKKKLAKPLKLQHAPCDKTTVLPFKRQTTHSSDRDDSSPAKMPALNLSIQDMESFALRKEHSEAAQDFVISKEARKRAEELFYRKGVHANYKREGFKKSISSKRLVNKSVSIPSNSVSETSLDNNAIQVMGTVASFKEVPKETGELFDFRSEQQKPKCEGFKLLPCPKSLNIRNVTGLGVKKSEANFNSKNHNPVQSMNNIAANEVRKQTEKLIDLKGIQQMPKIEGFKIPVCPKSYAKNPVDTHSTERLKTDINHNIVQSVGFEAAKEARKKAELLVKCGSIKITAKKTGEDFELENNYKRSSIFDEFLSTENVSFSSLCAKVQETKETWSNCLDHIYASFSKKSCKEPKETLSETKDPEAKEVNLATTIFVSCEDISKKFLLTFLTKFGTIAAIFIKNRNDAFVVFHVPNAARRSCTLMKGVATLGGVTVEVRMASAEDRAVISRLQGPKNDQPNTSQPPRRSSVWLEVASVKNQNLHHYDSRELVTYTVDDIF